MSSLIRKDGMTNSIWSFFLVPNQKPVELLSELEGKAYRKIWALSVTGALDLVCSRVPPTHFPISGTTWHWHS